DDVDRAAGVITLKEHKTARKTGRPRRIPIGRKLGELLDQAIGARTEGPVFLSPAGKAWRVENLSRTYSRLRDLAGLPRDLVLYLGRHECGTRICRLKGIEYARRLLGHTNISTTQRYMHLDEAGAGGGAGPGGVSCVLYKPHNQIPPTRSMRPYLPRSMR